MTPWDPNDLPECLIGYTGQFASTVWFKHLCNHFSKNFSVGTHYRGLKRYKNCFIASDAVSWLRQELKTNKFKAMMNREAVVRVMKMMHSNHQVFEDVRGQDHDQELFADNSRLFRFREYKIGFDDLLEQQVPQPAADPQLRQPFTPLENLPPLAPRVSKTSPGYNKIIKEHSKSSINGPRSISSSQRSYGNVSLNVEGSVHTLPRNLSNKSLKGLRRDKSISVQDLNEAPLNAAVNEEDDRRSEDGAVHNTSSRLNLVDSQSPTHSSAKEERLQTPCGPPRFSDFFPDRNEGPKKDSLMGWMEALEMSASEDGSDSGSSFVLGTRSSKLRASKSFNFNNKENKNPKTHLSFMSKSNDKTKKRMNREESTRRAVVSEKDYKLSLVVSLCKKLNVENISRVMSMDHVDPSTVRLNVVKGDEFGLVGKESRKDFPENICNMLNRMSEWPLKTYCKFRMGIERCDASVQAMFDVFLDFLESNPESIFPCHFHRLLVVVHDLCKVTPSKSQEHLPVARSISLKRDSAPITQSFSAAAATSSRDRTGSRGTKEFVREIRSSCRRSPNCEGSWKIDLARTSSERHPRHVESSNRRFGDYNSLFDENGGLPPNKTMRSKNGGFYFYREYPELMDLPGWRSNCSALDTGKRSRDDLVIRNSAFNRSHIADGCPTPLTPAYDPHDDLLVNRNSDVGEVNEHHFTEVLQLCFLTLGRSERRNFFRLFSFVEAVVSNRGICATRSKKDMIVEALVDVMTGSLENSDILEPTFVAIYKFFISNYRKILKVPHLDLNIDPESLEKYTARVTPAEYDFQSNNFTRNALVDLLRTIIEDPSLSEKARKEHLKKFEKGYPDIFYCFFPPSDLPTETKDIGTRFLDSFRRLRDNLWQS